MTQNDERGILHSHIFDRNIDKMWRLGINLKQFFASSLPL